MFSSPNSLRKLRGDTALDRADLRFSGIKATAPGGHGTEYGVPIPTISSPAEAESFVTARFAEGRATWAGAMFMPGRQEFEPTDLSGTTELAFRAAGDGKPYTVMVFTKQGGAVPVATTFQPAAQLGPHAVTWKQLGVDASDVIGIFIGATEAGPFRLAIDDVELR